RQNTVAVAPEHADQRAENVLLIVDQEQGRLLLGSLLDAFMGQIAVAQDLQGLLRRNRLAEIEALEEVAVVSTQIADLRRVLHAFGEHGHAELMAERDDRATDA